MEGGRATGVELEDGSTVAARVVVSNADPRRTFLGLVGREHLSESFARAVEALDFRSPSLKINLALDRLPEFSSRPGAGAGPQHRGTIHVGSEDLDALERSFEAARAGGLPERPMLELTLPSVVDESLAPPARHVASLFVQHVPYELAGSSWDAERDRFADRALALVDEVAPGFSSSVLHRRRWC